MEKVSGIGGFFFRAHDPDALAKWYSDNLGVSLVPQGEGDEPWMPDAGPCAFTPFEQNTDYFGDNTKMWMLNFRVRDLDAMVAQLRAAGVSVEVGTEAYSFGRFARLKDPEGNPLELWEPGPG